MSTLTVPLNQKDLKVRLTIYEDGVILNLASASVKKIMLYTPYGGDTPLQKTASFETDGTDGKMYFKTLDTDLSAAGWYHVRGYIEDGAFKGYTNKKSFLVEAL